MKRLFASALVIAAAATAWVMLQKKANEPAVADASPVTAEPSRTSREPRDQAPLRLPLADPRVVVKKSERRLLLFDGDRQVRAYRVGLGFAPVGDKTSQGDGRTPEGRFYVCVKNAASKFYLSLGLSYPGKEHAARGLRERIINQSQHDEIVRALGRRQRPPWDTRLGGEIFIHGNGSSSDWTWGCVALDNADMKELFDAMPKGAAVVIEP
ncbi:MAG TPA: L,D-transpeptidase [Blastocatellia bacterium]|nr:L,D-transpeptidase [Blastocatellia bacterium]